MAHPGRAVWEPNSISILTPPSMPVDGVGLDVRERGSPSLQCHRRENGRHSRLDKAANTLLDHYYYVMVTILIVYTSGITARITLHAVLRTSGHPQTTVMADACSAAPEPPNDTRPHIFVRIDQVGSVRWNRSQTESFGWVPISRDRMQRRQ